MNTNHKENLFLHCFARIEKLGPASLLRILKTFGTAEKAFGAPINSFRNLKFSEEIVSEINGIRRTVNIETERKRLEDAQIQLLSINEDHYPTLLKQITTPPALLYYRGNLALLNDKFALAVVGTRKISNYGRHVCEQLIPELVNNGFTIVSGLAYGIDATAHELTLKHAGRTVAVLGSDVDQRAIYPARNRSLAQRIVESNGLIISEYPPGSQPQPFHFPVRNRIISGITLGTLVIEADAKSGSLITAQTALEENREVFAVPGPIYLPTSRGTNSLIQRGAKLVTCAKDITDELNIGPIAVYRQMQATLLNSPIEEKILHSLITQPLNIDTIVEVTMLPVSTVSSTLIMLEMKGAVKNMGNQTYLKT